MSERYSNRENRQTLGERGQRLSRVPEARQQQGVGLFVKPRGGAKLGVCQPTHPFDYAGGGCYTNVSASFTLRVVSLEELGLILLSNLKVYLGLYFERSTMTLRKRFGHTFPIFSHYLGLQTCHLPLCCHLIRRALKVAGDQIGHPSHRET